MIPPAPYDINDGQVIFSLPSNTTPLHIALFDDFGVTARAVHNTQASIHRLDGVHTTRLHARRIKKEDVSPYDAIIFGGGVGRIQGTMLGKVGRDKVRAYVHGGGTYIGICAGANLALLGREWSLGIIHATVMPSTSWKRGQAYLDMELTEKGKAFLTASESTFKCRYHNGPIFKIIETQDARPVDVLTIWKQEIAKNNATKGIMINSPAIIKSTYGKGRVILVNGHPENTPGLENLIPVVLSQLTA